jgi:hypothetical protein
LVHVETDGSLLEVVSLGLDTLEADDHHSRMGERVDSTNIVFTFEWIHLLAKVDLSVDANGTALGSTDGHESIFHGLDLEVAVYHKSIHHMVDIQKDLGGRSVNDELLSINVRMFLIPFGRSRVMTSCCL